MDGHDGQQQAGQAFQGGQQPLGDERFRQHTQEEKCRRGQPGHEDHAQAREGMRGGLRGHDHHRGERRGADHERDGQGHDEGFALRIPHGGGALIREDQTQGDDAQHHAAADAQIRRPQLQQPQEPRPGGIGRHQGAQREEQFAQHHALSTIRFHLREQAQHHWQVAEGIQDEEERDGERNGFHDEGHCAAFAPCSASRSRWLMTQRATPMFSPLPNSL